MSVWTPLSCSKSSLVHFDLHPSQSRVRDIPQEEVARFNASFLKVFECCQPEQVFRCPLLLNRTQHVFSPNPSYRYARLISDHSCTPSKRALLCLLSDCSLQGFPQGPLCQDSITSSLRKERPLKELNAHLLKISPL